VDFSISGCPEGDGQSDAAPCKGPAPLDLQFTAIGPTDIDEVRWWFGDELNDAGPSDSIAPQHRFTLPGSYDVRLAALGPGGSAEITKNQVIEVVSASVGGACTLDDQCSSRTCLCNGNNCPSGFGSGICTQSCTSVTCNDGLCVDLAPTNPAEPAPWQGELCLPDCASAACPPGLSCTSLIDKSGNWVKACAPAGLLSPVGRSCVDDGGSPDSSLCASGLCIPEGARGMCTSTCTANSCPEGTACATFGGNLGSLCVAGCSTYGCDSDPFLACEAPGGGADKNFLVDQSPEDPAGYCAPKSCTGGDCGPDGQCTDGFCEAN
jgi:PKD repeat protein